MILITGVSSSPGYKIALKLSESYDVIGIYNEHPVAKINSIKYDLTKDPEKIVEAYKPEVLVHTAAIGNVDLCEENRDFCYNINVNTSRRLLVKAKQINAKIIYISTNYVFDGKKGMYKENDTPAPINYYGLTKLLSENIALSLGGTVVRIAGVYGTGYGRVNFGKYIVDKLSKNEKIDAVKDQFLSPTLNTQIGESVKKILEKDFNGIIHIAGPRLSRYDFALKICQAFGFDSALVSPVSINSFKFKAPRPIDSSLDNTLGEKITGIKLSDFNKSIEIFKGEYYAI
ncbi:MAG: NAD(P)-dependent oxidoreductase [Candidatus Anstonellales archaeon]